MAHIRLSLLELLLLQASAWIALWLISDYIASLLTVIITAILVAVLLLAFVAELIEPSKVPRRYFGIMGVSIIGCLLAAGIYLALFGGDLAFLEM